MHERESVASASRAQVIHSRAAWPGSDGDWAAALGARPSRPAENLIRQRRRKAVPTAYPVVACLMV
jgi:hypothetical protein